MMAAEEQELSGASVQIVGVVAAMASAITMLTFWSGLKLISDSNGHTDHEFLIRTESSNIQKLDSIVYKLK